MGFRIVLLMIASGLAGIGGVSSAEDLMTIDIDVLNTWQADSAQEILDLAWVHDGDGLLLFRSNQDGMIFMADPEDGSFLGELALPSGSSGFGLCFDDYGSRYFINSDISPLVFHTDGSGVWDSFPNPAGAGGMGMAVDYWTTGLAEVCPTSSNLLYTFQGDGTRVADYLIQGITGTMSGLAAHEIATSDRSQAPYALVVTCSDQPEFFFLVFNDGPVYSMYGQEPCPVTVDQSLGITLAEGRNTFFWSYRGLDGEYYVSELFIPILGNLESATWAAVKAGIQD
jgi:WD40 repeat protein